MPSAVTPDADDVSQEYALLVVDMKDYSKIPEAKMAPTLADLESILSTVFEQCGIDDVVTLDNAVKDRGDGSIYVVSSRHAARLVDPLLGHLKQALDRREQSRLASSPPIRLRASVHVGPLVLPDHRGDAAVDACRLVESVAVRRAMDAALDNDLPLAAAVSDPVYDRSVRAERTRTLKPRDFHPATALVNGNVMSGWIETGRTGHRQLAIGVLETMALHPDTGPGVRRWLYDWAKQKTVNRELVSAVAEICAGQLGQKYPRIALTRLRILAARSDDLASEAVADAVRALANAPEQRILVLSEIIQWAESPESTTRKAGTSTFLALTDVTDTALLPSAQEPTGDPTVELINQLFIRGWRAAPGRPLHGDRSPQPSRRLAGLPRAAGHPAHADHGCGATRAPPRGRSSQRPGGHFQHLGPGPDTAQETIPPPDRRTDILPCGIRFQRWW
ncbi:hypothetical protein [Streptomyces sp. NPDC006551]|uniref:hypothetical protein n=1 Tax=Streptomyces sp. NPDC006551 TaxID=3157178 RepID=UPI0033BCE10B